MLLHYRLLIFQKFQGLLSRVKCCKRKRNLQPNLFAFYPTAQPSDSSASTSEVTDNTDNEPAIVISEAHMLSRPARKPGNRTFQASWKIDFPWVCYDEVNDVARCEVCTWAVQHSCVTERTLNALKHRYTCWIEGFNDWRKGRAAIRKHGSSEIHRECVSAKLNDSSRAADLVTDISVSKMKENRIALNALFDAICFLGRQGLALRGYTEENSNLVQSLKLLGKYNDTVKNWISRKTRFLSAEIQNEILESLALRVLRHEIHQVKAARLFSIISDETADVSNKEQVCICIRYVDDKFIIHESFIGLYETCETSSATLHKLIQSAITSVGLSFNDCRGQSYDGAANMSGHLSGVQARFKEMYPAMLYVHCSGHNLNLAIQDTFRNNTDAANSLATLNGVVNFIKASPKRLSMFENFRASENDFVVGGRYSALRPLCPTRWAMRFEAIDIFIKNYDTILNWLQTVATDSSMDGKSRSGARSFLLSLEKFSIFYCLNVMHMLLEKIQPAHRAIQSRSINIGRCYELIENLALSFTECLNTTEKSTFF
ncbi:zinc finger MYM-type protein 1-like [Ciona intestinalis]